MAQLLATTVSGTLTMSGAINFSSTTYAIEKPSSTTFTTGTIPSTSCVAITANNGDRGTLLVGDDYCIIANSGDSKLLRVFDEDVTTDYTGTTVGTGLCFMVESGGNAYAVSFYASSDRRLKDNIKKLDLDPLEIINSLKLKEFNFKTQTDKENKHIGLIAQDLRKVLPDAEI